MFERVFTYTRKINGAVGFVLNAVLCLIILFFFLTALDMLSISLHSLGSEFTNNVLAATENPAVGLFIGLLSTAIVQSSSLTTSLTVAFVSSNTLALDNAIPIIMGANIGTTVTCAIVSLAHVAKKYEFQKAITVAAMHSMFNIMTAIIVFPLERATGLLDKSSSWMGAFFSDNSTELQHFLHADYLSKTVKPVSKSIVLAIESEYIATIIAIMLLVISLRSLITFFKLLLIGNPLKTLEKYAFGNSLKALISGLAGTAIVQSSSVMSSLIIPFAATGKINQKNAYAFLVGANLGTTFTAIIASIGQSEAGISIAWAHFLFNLIGFVVFFLIYPLRYFPQILSDKMGTAAMEHRWIGFVYFLFTFFIIPYFLILFTSK